MKVVIVLFAIAAVVALVAFCVLYVRYTKSRPAQWKRGVLAAAAEHRERLESARRRLREIDRAIGGDRLRDEYLERYLRGLPVEDLIRFPGIGPVTASRLRDAGVTHIPAVERSRLADVPGVGPSREKDIRKAVQQVRREAESRFDAGACPEAAAYAEERKRREGQLGNRKADAEQAVQIAEVALAFLDERVRIARGITFLGHLFGHRPPGLADELMSQPLTPPPPPVVEKPAGRPAPTPAVVSPAPAAAASLLAASTPAWMLEARPLAAVAPAVSPRPTPPPPPIDDSPLARLRVVAGFGLAVARADGRIAAAERKQVRAFLARRYAQPPDLAERLDSLLAEVEADVPTLGDALWNVKRVLPAEAWPDINQFAVSVADSAGERNAREVECLARVAEELGLGPASPGSAAVPAASASASGRDGHAPGDDLDAPLSEADCRAALEIAPETPLGVDLIRRQYRLMADRFAADRFSSHGPEFVRMAADRRTRAERAARQLLTVYNEPLDPPAADPPADPRHNPDLDAVFGA